MNSYTLYYLSASEAAVCPSNVYTQVHSATSISQKKAYDNLPVEFNEKDIFFFGLNTKRQLSVLGSNVDKNHKINFLRYMCPG